MTPHSRKMWRISSRLADTLARRIRLGGTLCYPRTISLLCFLWKILLAFFLPIDDKVLVFLDYLVTMLTKRLGFRVGQSTLREILSEERTT